MTSTTKRKATTAKQESESAAKPSRKQRVRKLFDEQGQEVAWTNGLRLKLKEGTLRTWFAAWRREGEAKKSPPAKSKPVHQIATS